MFGLFKKKEQKKIEIAKERPTSTAKALDEYHKKYGGIAKEGPVPIENLRKDIRSVSEIDVIKCSVIKGGGVCTVANKKGDVFQLELADWNVESKAMADVPAWNTYFKVKD